MDTNNNLQSNTTDNNYIINNNSNILNNLNNSQSNMNNTNYSTNILNNNLPCITDNKKIYIHKPSDFLKNKYTFFGNVSNNSEILSLNSRKTFHSPRFSMKDIKLQIKKENAIIGSILKDEVDSLPNLLKNYLPTANKNKNFSLSNEKFKSENPKGFNNIMLNKFQNNINSINDNLHSNYNRFSDNKVIRFNSNAEQLATKTNGIINLNFLISSPKRKNYNFGINEMFNGAKINYNQFNNIKINSSLTNTKTSIFQAKNQNRKNNHICLDNTSIIGNLSETSNLVIKPKKNNSFKDYLTNKVASLQSTRSSKIFFLFLLIIKIFRS